MKTYKYNASFKESDVTTHNVMSFTFAFNFNLSVAGCGGLNENCPLQVHIFEHCGAGGVC